MGSSFAQRRMSAIFLISGACSPSFTPSGAESTSTSATTTHVSSTLEPPITLAGVDVDSGEDGFASVGFLDEQDLASVNVQCDVWTQDCPKGQKCMPWANDGGNSWNATKCTDLDPNPAQPGEPCQVVESGVSGIDNCAIASMCWNVDPDTNEGVCVPFCVGGEVAPRCEDPQRECVIFSDGVLINCHSTCDPVLQDCVDKGLLNNGCFPTGDTFVCWFVASGPAEGHYGSPCDFINVCLPGLFCANAAIVPGCLSAQGCCSEFCSLSDPETPAECAGAADGQVCVPWFDDDLPPFLMHVGACALPIE